MIYELCCILQDIISRIKLGGTRSADFFKQSEFQFGCLGLENNTDKKQLD